MSDCSTEAMKPKAKTCGNCGYGERRAISCPKRDGLFIAKKPGCEHWKEATDTLEQRNQQLEQIACEMFQDIESAFVRGKFKPEAYADYRDRLEAAGLDTHGFKTEGEEHD